jgi:Txe/YoeB family toxin of Txe-Axe toxin-antitoxin module
VLNIPIVADGTTISNNPIAANDDGLIEKEWVNKAKAIISNTRNDPYMREEKVNELQVDYLKKRYGEGLNVIK